MLLIKRIKRSILILTSLVLVGLFIPGSVTGKDDLIDSAKHQRIEEMYARYKKSFPKVEDLSAEQILNLLGKRSILFVDVRDPEEQEVSMLPEAMPHREFLKNPEAYKDRMIVGYCTISYRSGKLAKKLQEKRLWMINMRGGLLAWLHAGGKVLKGGNPTNRVHVYGEKWNLAPSNYEAVW